MTSPLRNLALSLALIAVPAGGFALAEAWIAPSMTTTTASAAPLGDMSAYQTIVADTKKIAASGDLAFVDGVAGDRGHLGHAHVPRECVVCVVAGFEELFLLGLADWGEGVVVEAGEFHVLCVAGWV